jgi:hypothetical protein
MVKAAIVLLPLQHVESCFGQVGLVGVVLREKWRWKQRKKNLLLPLLRASRGRRRPTMPFKTAPFRSFSFFFFA